MNRSLLLSFLALTTVGTISLAGCSDDPVTNPGASDVGKWPARPSGGAATTTVRTFAANTINLGETGEAWKNIGYNLDGKISTNESTDVCAPVNGQKSALSDGARGIDNAFGNKIVSYISSIASGPSARMTSALTNGSSTLIIEVTGLSDDAKQSAVGVSGRLFGGAKFDPTGAKKPTFTTADDWPARDDLTPKATFANGYVAGGTWVSGDPADVTISLVFSGQSLSLTVHSAVITFDHTAAGVATNGVIAGVIKTSELEAETQKIAGAISTSFCAGSANAAKLQQTIQEASDIRADGTNAAGATCDGISVALGFTAKEIGAVKRAQVDATSVSPCP